MRIIPAIDVIDGKCVRLTKGDYSTQIIYNENPLEVAKAFEDAGLRYLHLVDLDGARSSRIVNYKTLYNISTHTNLQVDFGGGLKTDDDLSIALENGAFQVTIGSIAAENPALFLDWLLACGTDRVILGADSRNRKITARGWTEDSDLDVLDFIQKFENQGVELVTCTDISKDGMLQGPAFDLYGEILDNTHVRLIASGGVTSIEDVKRLCDMGCEGAVIGKAIYEGRITLKELAELC
ncbi:MAG TPA: 1-(5-phosphoribosyl)-5-[(5-phosphoribosylamino)methylideneamino]imidazole-4-carboxamide isomerase [Saprospiraceae bacterium]|jgi:phosphoribosylformimino-5-aminoimidazole carboxamide ribotide isomerase|nr:1-(5-phosphoribosyl)-5-[(5-phosphoribosylamino)methylideneamino]imidazole-4-carboxamide isomerase [Saprospiraceae bacterium]HRK80907.1 1-(5-phosphoribosyl)-5-[(5-phosphoribosylamino)methylideneamino]imidazole-4-carboxamide isomerase [Saprospiraceae bacterium]